MPAPPNRPTPCVDWRDWEANKDEHPACHYWRIVSQDDSASEYRLGERLYIMACLLWSSLHDQFLGRKFLGSFPNWSAICSYYSMVHALRLFWFTTYGSYPTSHFQMAEGLTTRGKGAAANWQNQEIGQGRAIRVTAFQGLLREAFGSQAFSDKLPLVGEVFRQAKELRNDSNYESLVLAHQYWNESSGIGNPVNVTQEFSVATESMRRASESVLRFVVSCVQLSFGESNWIAANSPFESNALYGLLLAYVRDKLLRFAEATGDRSATVNGWCGECGSLAADMEAVSIEQIGPAKTLKQFIGYDLFNVKRNIMRGFQEKTHGLHEAVAALVRTTSLF
jgi:hypothetical protein